MAITLLVVIGIVILINNKSPENKPRGASAPRSVALTCICATERKHIYPMMRSYADSDVMAQLGLVRRGAALKLDPGARVSPVTTDGPVTLVSIASGIHAGQSCWLATTFLH